MTALLGHPLLGPVVLAGVEAEVARNALKRAVDPGYRSSPSHPLSALVSVMDGSMDYGESAGGGAWDDTVALRASRTVEGRARTAGCGRWRQSLPCASGAALLAGPITLQTPGCSKINTKLVLQFWLGCKVVQWCSIA